MFSRKSKLFMFVLLLLLTGCASPAVVTPVATDVNTPVPIAPTISPTEMQAPSQTPQLETGARHGIKMSLDSSMPLDDGYLLTGSMPWSENNYPAHAVISSDIAKVVDANGQEIPFESVYADLPSDEEYRSYWALKVLGKDFAAPLNISMDSVDVNIRPVVFRFDPGADPKPGQSWDINQDVQIGDIQARILKAQLTTMDSPDLVFEFDLQVEPDALADVYISIPINQCNGGGGSFSNEPSEIIQAYVNTCRTDLPPGPLEAQVSEAIFWGPWQVTWTP